MSTRAQATNGFESREALSASAWMEAPRWERRRAAADLRARGKTKASREREEWMWWKRERA